MCTMKCAQAKVNDADTHVGGGIKGLSTLDLRHEQCLTGFRALLESEECNRIAAANVFDHIA